jgi:hypothetical protein
MAVEEEQQAPGVSVRAVEIGVALIFIALGLLVMADSNRVGFGWSDNRPEPGYFPFYISLIMILASAVVLGQAIRSKAPRKVFVANSQLRSVLQLLVPTIVYVALIPFIGIYVASALYLAYFMRKLGRYGWTLVVSLSIAIPFALFLLFDVWFLVALPKGPLEEWLGY